jgi:hypothetical protein
VYQVDDDAASQINLSRRTLSLLSMEVSDEIIYRTNVSYWSARAAVTKYHKLGDL